MAAVANITDYAEAIEPAFQKLVNVLGRDRATVVRKETLMKLGISELSTPNDRLRFGEALIAHGGLLQAIGRAIKIQAILQGAVET